MTAVDTFSSDPITPPAHTAERQLVSFAAHIWADAAGLAETFEGLSTAELHAVFGRAAGCLDLKRLVLAGRPLLRQDLLRRPDIFLLASALYAHGRYAEAAEAMRAPRMPPTRKARHVRLRAAALAAAGDLEAALAVVDEAKTADPALPLEPFRLTLARTVQLGAREAELESGAEILELARGYMSLGLDEPAAALLGRTLSRPSTDLGLTFAEQLQLADLALQTGLADATLRYLETLPQAQQDDDSWRAIAAAARALAGRPAEAAGTARPAGRESPSLRFWRAVERERGGDLAAAVEELCGLAEDFKHDLSIRTALARCVGKSVLAEVRPAFAPGRTGRIINVMPFFNELDLLRLHLEEMSPWVDRFVIVEATSTFTGREKPMVFEANRRLFEPFEDKIVYVPVREFPAHLTSPWGREFYQRDMAIAGASGLCGEEDYIVETDVDEIVDERALRGFEADFAALELKLSRFFLNYRPAVGNPDRAKAKSTIFKAKYRARYGLSDCRFSLARIYPDAHLVRDAGWHFTSVFDAAGISLKVNSYAHQENAKPEFRSSEHFKGILERLRAGELEPGWERSDLDDSFPAYVRSNRRAFADLIL